MKLLIKQVGAAKGLYLWRLDPIVSRVALIYIVGQSTTVGLNWVAANRYSSALTSDQYCRIQDAVYS